MEAALYDEAGGFYARGVRLGLGGAFSTAPTRAPRFAAAVAAEVRACFEALGRPPGFALVEAGPGDGTLAAALAELAPVERIVLIERAAGMHERQRAALAGAPVPVEWAAAAQEVRVEHGMVVANELFDALAVRLLQPPDEVYVDVAADGRFVEVLRPAPDAPIARPRPGGRCAVAPEAPALLEALARTIGRGRLLVADYGDDAPAGTHGGEPVRTYLHGMPGGGALEAPGRQDLTADVDFGALRRAAAAAGLCERFYGDQAEWLRSRAGGDADL
ncbi:MAG TPA: SAM-dependent methyltransferase, partial [Solirubrobacteraceae bacterium]